MKTKKERRAAGVAARRSGDYEQTMGGLKDGVGYCCLGVACDVSELGKWEDDGVYSCGEEHKCGGYLTDVICDYYGLSTISGTFDDERSLAELNDSGKTFNEIADIIESEPPGLFLDED